MSSPNGYSASAAAAAAAAAGRKRQAPSAPVYSPNETLNQMTQEAEQRQQDKYIVQKEYRAIRAQEMEKQRKEDEEREREEMNNNNSANNNSRYNSRSSSVTTSSGSSNKGRLNSTSRQLEENTVDPDSPRELKKRLAELEEKYTKHAIYQTQFENDNQKLLYEVDILKDIIEEHEELIIELRRQYKEKSRELDFQKRSNKDVQTDFLRLKEILKQRDELIQQSGLVLYTDNETKDGLTNGDSLASHFSDIKSVLPAALVSPETSKLLDMLGEGTIDDKLRKLLDTKHELKEQNSKLKLDLEEKESKIGALEKKLAQNMSKMQDTQEQANDLHELQRQYTKEINDFKMKNQKLEHENIVIKQDLQRLQTQLKYMQTNFDELEASEQRLNKEKREAQREYRELKAKYQDNLLDNKRLQDRIDSLEFYAKTNTNSSVFHNIPTTTLNPTSSTTTGSSSISSRARTPAPSSTRQRLPSTAINSTYSNGINYGTTTSSASTNSTTTSNPLSPTSNTTFSYFDNYRTPSRPASRQSSVERTFASNDFSNSNTTTSTYGGLTSFNLNSSTSGAAMRSRNPSPVRTFDSASSSAPTDRWSSSAGISSLSSTLSSALSSLDRPSKTYDSHRTYDSTSSSTPTSSGISTDRWSSNSRNLSSLPPVYDSPYSRLRTREPSTDITNIQLRTRRDTSQERSLRPSTSSSLLKFRRSSFVETANSPLSKYY